MTTRLLHLKNTHALQHRNPGVSGDDFMVFDIEGFLGCSPSTVVAGGRYAQHRSSASINSMNAPLEVDTMPSVISFRAFILVGRSSSKITQVRHDNIRGAKPPTLPGKGTPPAHPLS